MQGSSKNSHFNDALYVGSRNSVYVGLALGNMGGFVWSAKRSKY
jgi:hypothetical protein